MVLTGRTRLRIAIPSLTALALFSANGCAYVTDRNLETTSCRPELELPTPSPLAIDYRVVHRVTDLPKAVRSALTPMADPGEPYNDTDVVTSGLPFQRLTFGGYSNEWAFVYFEQGGFAPVQCLVIFQILDDQATEFFATTVGRDAKNLEQLRAIVL